MNVSHEILWLSILSALAALGAAAWLGRWALDALLRRSVRAVADLDGRRDAR